jgi:hypothetical protein
MEYFNLDYWNDYKMEDSPEYRIPDYRLMRLLSEVADVVEDKRKLQEAFKYIIDFEGIPQDIKQKALEMVLFEVK